MAAAALSHSLGCRCGTPVCERTQCPLHGLWVQGRLGMQGRHAAARAAARPSAPQEAMACFKIKQVLGVS